jgi:hypothetical protein
VTTSAASVSWGVATTLWPPAVAKAVTARTVARDVAIHVAVAIAVAEHLTAAMLALMHRELWNRTRRRQFAFNFR